MKPLPTEPAAVAALLQRGHFQQALEAAQASLAQGESAVWLNLAATSAHALNRLDAAEDFLVRLHQLLPGQGDILANLGQVRFRLGRLEEAEETLGRALALDARQTGAWYTLGLLLQSRQRWQEAEAALQRVLDLDGNHLAACHGLAVLHLTQERLDQADRAFARAVALLDRGAPGSATYADAPRLHYQRGNLLQRLGRLEAARESYGRALVLQPGHGHALSQRLSCHQQLVDWSALAPDLAALLSLPDGAGIQPFVLLSLPGVDPERQRRAAAGYAQATLAGSLSCPPRVAPESHPRRDRLRIGYLSADFQEHATLRLLAGVLRHHDRARFHIHAYSFGTAGDQDAWRRQAIADVETFVDLSTLTDDQAAARIAADGIDLLVDLKGHTLGARPGIQARRPAPVVVSWLGYPGSLGHPRLADYLIGDPVVTPPESAAHYSETLVLLPHCYQPNDNRRELPGATSRQAWGLPDAGLVLASFNQPYKITAPMFGLWCRLLAGLEDSVLWLLSTGPGVDARLRDQAQARGIAPERLVFARPTDQASHMARLALADLALDTFPYGSHTTGSDALWAGVPLVARRGETFASRVSASLLAAAGLAELVAGDDQSYVDLALALGRDAGRRLSLRQRLVEARSRAPLFDTPGFTRDLERLFQALWDQHARGVRHTLVLSPD